MGYYSTVEFDLRIKEKFLHKVDEIKKYLELEEGKGTDLGNYHGDLIIDKVAGDVYFDEEYRKFYEHQLLCQFLAPYVAFGSIFVTGEDSENWMIEFDGKGGYTEYEGEVFYGFDPYKEFIDRMGHLLTPQLKKDLERWRVTLKI